MQRVLRNVDYVEQVRTENSAIFVVGILIRNYAGSELDQGGST